jgi:hypothetical protein
MPGDRHDERTARLQVGETVVPRGGGGEQNIYLVVDGEVCKKWLISNGRAIEDSLSKHKRRIGNQPLSFQT